MDIETNTDWLSALKIKKSELEAYLETLKTELVKTGPIEKDVNQRPTGEFRYLELPVKLDNLMAKLGRVISTTELTDQLLQGHGCDRDTWVKTNRNVSRLLNNRLEQGRVRKLGRVQGSNRSVLWEWVDV